MSQSREEWEAQMNEAEQQHSEHEAAAAQAQAEHDHFVQQEISELEKQIAYHEKKISEYLSQINHLQNAKP